ncbi:VC0807 family protein [Microlunatus speluncae]|uniref:VC0807 family protein n=1 Tax=Microlunatus speluncae TaxID=2594267 RepID=UPI00126638E2|nr:VC0807 family protein [Microlunatus speluncae]
MVNNVPSDEAVSPASPATEPGSTGGARNPQREIALSLVVNAVLPIATFYGLRAAGVDQWLALMLGLIAPAAMAVHSVLTKRRVDVLAGLVMAALVLSVGLSLLTGSPRTLLARDGVVTAAIGGWMIFTLTRTPYYLSALRLFTGGTLRDKINSAWSDRPDFRRVVYRCTVIWGSALLLDAASTVIFAYTLPIDLVPLIGAVKLVVLIILAEVSSQVWFRLKGVPLLSLDQADGQERS